MRVSLRHFDMLSQQLSYTLTWRSSASWLSTVAGFGTSVTLKQTGIKAHLGNHSPLSMTLLMHAVGDE